MRLLPDHTCLALAAIRRGLLFVAHAACFDTTKTQSGRWSAGVSLGRKVQSGSANSQDCPCSAKRGVTQENILRRNTPGRPMNITAVPRFHNRIMTVASNR